MGDPKLHWPDVDLLRKFGGKRYFPGPAARPSLAKPPATWGGVSRRISLRRVRFRLIPVNGAWGISCWREGSAPWQTPARSGGRSRGGPQAPRDPTARRRAAPLTRSATFSRAGARPGCSPYASCPCWCSRPPRCCRATRPTRCWAAPRPAARPHCTGWRQPCTSTGALLDQYWLWFSGLVTGHLGHSLVNGRPVWGYVAPRLINSAVLMGITGVIGAVAGVALGVLAALRRDRWLDHACSVTSLAVTALPEFVVGDRPGHRCSRRWSPTCCPRCRCCRRAATPGTPRSS